MAKRGGLEKRQVVGGAVIWVRKREFKWEKQARRKPLMTVRLPGKGSKKDARA